MVLSLSPAIFFCAALSMDRPQSPISVSPLAFIFFSNRGFRLKPHDKLVALGINELLSQVEEGEGCHSDNQSKIETTKGEHLPLTQCGCHRLLAYQSPLAPSTIFSLILHCRARAEVTLKKSLMKR